MTSIRFWLWRIESLSSSSEKVRRDIEDQIQKRIKIMHEIDSKLFFEMPLPDFRHMQPEERRRMDRMRRVSRLLARISDEMWNSPGRSHSFSLMWRAI
jgi:hypothetical protein